jgi:antitoxin (DNA-binding transcriptional repressor) of toxin-antitoxin stability system
MAPSVGQCDCHGAELKNRLSFLNKVKAGHEVLVRDRNTPIARILPISHESADDEIMLLAPTARSARAKAQLMKDFATTTLLPGSFPPIGLVRKSTAAEAYTFRHQPLLLHKCVLAGRPNLSAGADHAMPRQACRTAAHSGRNLSGSDANDAADFPVGENAAARNSSHQAIDFQPLRLHLSPTAGPDLQRKLDRLDAFYLSRREHLFPREVGIVARVP